ncbi:MAG: hypothetical protein MUE46_18945 [Xanthomonadales bacterium]|jgi:hypothetical protein|nr:hypothetical protein [Xanthomonadales bacterium]
MLHALVAVAPGVFVMLVGILAFTVPVWVPVVCRGWHSLRGRLHRHVREGERAVAQYLERNRQRADFEAEVERYAFDAGLPDDHYAGLVEHMGVYWERYSRGQVSLHCAMCECYAYINRRTRARIGATS